MDIELEDNEPEYTYSDLGDIINELKNMEAKLRKREEAYKNTQHEYCIDEIKELKESVSIENTNTDVPHQDKPVNDIDDAFTTDLIDFFCRKYGISSLWYLTLCIWH